MSDDGYAGASRFSAAGRFSFSTVKDSLKGISDAYDTIYPIAFKLQLTARDETVLSLHSEFMPECGKGR